MKACNVKGCENPHRAKGWCQTHYKQMRKGWDMTKAKPVTPQKRDSVPVEDVQPLIEILMQGRAVSEVATMLEVTERTVYRIRTDKGSVVFRKLADRVRSLVYGEFRTEEGVWAAEWAQTSEGRRFVDLCRDGEVAA